MSTSRCSPPKAKALDIERMHLQLQQHAQQEAFVCNTRDKQVLRSVLSLWVQFCISAITSLFTIGGLLISIRSVQGGVQWAFHLTIEAKYTLCRLMYSKDLADLLPPCVADKGLCNSIQAQTSNILDPFRETYAETLQQYLEAKGVQPLGED